MAKLQRSIIEGILHLGKAGQKRKITNLDRLAIHGNVKRKASLDHMNDPTKDTSGG